MKSLTALLATVAAPALAHAPGHAHVHSSDTIAFAVAALVGTALLGGWLILRTVKARS